MKISGKSIGEGFPVYIIAEISANHNGSYKKAIEIIRAAVDAGADAVKLQTYTADTLTLDCDRDCFRIGPGTVWEGKTLHELYSEAYTPWDWQPGLKKEAEKFGLACFSSPFDFSAVDFLEKMDVPAYKIASFELVDIPLIRHVASKGRPVIMSVGMATEDEISDAVDAVRSAGNQDIALLKCTSAYPAGAEGMNLRTIPDLAARFGVVSGLSDHSMSNEAAIVATALGASIIEKHLTLSRSDGGPDSSFSLEPAEFAEMVRVVRIAEKCLGRACYEISEQEKVSRVFRRSLFAVKDIAAGETLTPENIRSIRPADGLPPKHLDKIIGSTARRDIKKGTPLTWDRVEE